MGQANTKYSDSSSGRGGLLCRSTQNKKDMRKSSLSASRIRRSQTRGQDMTETYDELIGDSIKRLA